MYCPDCGEYWPGTRYSCPACNLNEDDLEAAAAMHDDDYDDGQPSEYDEWQDVFGGDVEEYGTYGDYPDSGDW